ncbi:MAG: TGS domain-containing protein [Candidatus Eremiobacteraeota bacterium]|nr:TGS domain-containing protein [Candidatus Eremiobacteraeota bacterium]
MPANLTPQYIAAEQRFRDAKTNEEKISALEEMYATIPKHKGTEKMQADIRRRIKKLTLDSAKKQSGKSQFSYHVEKEGARQVIIAGFPNSGKSALLSSVTNAKSEVADYPYTTRKVIPGMMKFENVPIQMVDTPAISDEFMETWLPGIIRNADGLVLTVDLGAQDPLEQLETVIGRLQQAKILLADQPSREEALQSAARIRTLVACTKAESEEAMENFSVLRELYGARFPLIALSCLRSEHLEEFKRGIFEWLEIVRVYTRAPGRKADPDHPHVLAKGSTVLDLARAIHKEFEEKFKYARIWGSKKYEGQMVQKDYVLQDQDTIELHSA